MLSSSIPIYYEQFRMVIIDQKIANLLKTVEISFHEKKQHLYV